MKASFDAIIEEANKETFDALERLLPKSEKDFLRNIGLANSETVSDL